MDAFSTCVRSLVIRIMRKKLQPNTLGKVALGLVSITCALPALAQSTFGACQISLAYSPVATVPLPSAVSAVPGLGLLGVGALAAVLGVMAWRKQGKNGHRALSIALLAGAAFLAMHGSDSLIQSVRAASPYEFNNANGGTVTDTNIAFAKPSPTITVTNTTSGRIKISSNANAAETGTCTPGAEIAPGGSCTTQSVCPVIQILTVTAKPTAVCSRDPIWSYTADGVGNSVYAAAQGTPPTFDPANADVNVSMTQAAYLILPANPTEMPSNEDLGKAASGIATFTLTAPPGYGFWEDGAVSSTYVINVPYDGCTQGGGA